MNVPIRLNRPGSMIAVPGNTAALGAYCRFESSLDLRRRERSLLIAARHRDAQYS
jgi:hypothetical protein